MNSSNGEESPSTVKRGIPLVIAGLPQAGKTTFVQRLLTGKFKKTSATMGVNVETAKIGGIKFDIFDLGGHQTFRDTIWTNYIKMAYGFIFIIDSSDSDNFSLAKKEFWRCVDLKEEDEEFLILFICNKSDLEESQSLETIINDLELYKLSEKINASYYFIKTSMKTGENVNASLSWLQNNSQKIASNKKITPFMFLLTEINGLPIIEFDRIGLKEDPSLISGFVSAISSFSQQLFGKKDSLQYFVSGAYKQVLTSNEEYIFSLIIPSNEQHEEARRILDLIRDYIPNVKDLTDLEEFIFKTLNIDPSNYDIKKVFQ
ncbi:MAG: GTP-binding protein [Candidatus Heimdallarchaeota archaeon]|nr:GTP-binding protein [Candidatus Heimdallarchaeota archaeon]